MAAFSKYTLCFACTALNFVKNIIMSNIPSTEDLLKHVDTFEKSTMDSGTNAGLKGENAKNEEWEGSRSPSPVIIWRPSSRVELATDIPKELKL